MKKNLLLLVIAFMVLAFSTSSISGVQSLRGNKKLDAEANKVIKYKVNVVEGGIKRNYKEQPPLIPHKISKYKISLKSNGCMKCHSEKAYKKEKAPRVGDSHYINREGKILKTLFAGRYFCDLCHVIQVVADELIENQYDNGD